MSRTCHRTSRPKDERRSRRRSVLQQCADADWPCTPSLRGQPRGHENAEPVGASVEERVFTPAEIERRRKQLLKAISAFEKMISNLAASPKAASNGLTARTAFIMKSVFSAASRRTIST